MISIITHSQWIKQTSNTTKTLHSIWFTNEHTGVIVGDSGTILRTVDEGSVWTSISSGTIKNLNSVTFSSSGKGFAVGDGGIVLKSIDGGITWTIINTHCPSENLYSVKFPTADTGFIVGDMGLVLKTLDGGSTWYCLLTIILAPLYSAYFSDVDNGYYVGNASAGDSSKGFIYRTNEASFTHMSENRTGLYSVSFPDVDTGFAVGEYSTIVKTTNRGITWDLLSHDSAYFFSSVWFINSNTGYLSGSDGIIKKTVDGGINWNVSHSRTTQLLRNIYFLNVDTGYAVGDSGTILKTNNGGVISLENNISAESVFMVYPNPAYDKIRIIPEKESPEWLTLTITNLSGTQNMSREFQNQKVYELDLSSYSKGMYILKIQTRNGIECKKLVIR